jgi:hypothetical protein
MKSLKTRDIAAQRKSKDDCSHAIYCTPIVYD